MSSDWLTLDEAADLAGRSRRTIQRWLQQSPKAFVLREGGWSGSRRVQLVSRESLTAFAEAHGLSMDDEAALDEKDAASDEEYVPQHDSSAPQRDGDVTWHANDAPQRADGVPRRDSDAPQHVNGTLWPGHGATGRDSGGQQRDVIVERLMDRLDAAEKERAAATQQMMEMHRQLAAAEAEARAAKVQTEGAERVLAEVRRQAEQQLERMRTLEAQNHDALERVLALERMLGAAMAEIQRYRSMGPIARLMSKPNVPEPQQQPPLFLSGPNED